MTVLLISYGEIFRQILVLRKILVKSNFVKRASEFFLVFTSFCYCANIISEIPGLFENDKILKAIN